ncbi:hypothetical protein Ahy_A01g003247 [Arachis hypogaea]|uniref:Ubiquitin-like protease family profile domain-containing protein n=1 Tax=Arachis hypogaea TaxID=3818 RepID=A0A445ESG9_ARAHY|nr:hypothetical protein Ahy_A01g003247 [Arachis hypogaea]
MTHVKETKDSTDQYDPLFILNHKENFEGLIHHFMSLIPGEQVESTVVNTHCMILNDIKCPQFEKDIYYVPTDIVETMARITLIQRPRRPTGSMSIDVHTNASVLTKENSHRIYLGYWWLWIADVRKKEFYVLDSANKKKKEIPDLRIKLNKIVGLIISQMKVYTGAEPLMEEGDREEAEYIRLNGQRTRLEYGANIIFHKLNKMRDQIIRACEAIRLPKPSAALSIHFCKFTYGDIYGSK